VTETQSLDLLRRLGEELRELFADERTAIAKLDHAKLTELAGRKQDLAHRLEEARTSAPASIDRDVKLLFAAVRAEAHATAMLARAATEAVRALLGIEQTGYDRRARSLQTTAPRLLTTY
jgi:hypothetical protein